MKKLFVLLLFLSTLPVLAKDNTGNYKYYSRAKLWLNLKGLYRKAQSQGKTLKVKVVDELVRVWASQKLEEDDEGKWIRFDTKYFRCIILKSNRGTERGTSYPKGAALIEKIDQYQRASKSAKKIKKTLLNKKTTWLHHGLVALYGRVVRSNRWGKISEKVQDNKVKPEQIILVVDYANVPRSRFYELYKKK